MSGVGTFFDWVQGSEIYQQIHAEAVQLLPPGNGRTWLDVGTGPGLTARLAAEHGYDVVGIDRDRAMIDLARRRARDMPNCRFEVGDLGHAGQHRADVVSAASVLCTLADPASGLRQLLTAARPGGTVLVIETTATLGPPKRLRAAHPLSVRSRAVLNIWARARRTPISPAVWNTVPPEAILRHPLLEGMIEATIISVPAPTPP